MRDEAPAERGLEHVVLEHEVARVGPVVGDVAGVVVAHHVDAPALRGLRSLRGARAAVRVRGRAPHALLGLGDEPVHRAPVDISRGVGGPVRTAVVEVGRIVVRGYAASVDGVRDTDAGRYPSGTGIRPEVAVERPVLLHDDHDVPDLVDPGRRSNPDLQRCRARLEVPRVGREQDAPLLPAALDELERGREARVRAQARLRQRAPAAASQTLQEDLLAPVAR